MLLIFHIQAQLICVYTIFVQFVVCMHFQSIRNVDNSDKILGGEQNRTETLILSSIRIFIDLRTFLVSAYRLLQTKLIAIDDSII